MSVGCTVHTVRLHIPIYHYAEEKPFGSPIPWYNSRPVRRTLAPFHGYAHQQHHPRHRHLLHHRQPQHNNRREKMEEIISWCDTMTGRPQMCSVSEHPSKPIRAYQHSSLEYHFSFRNLIYIYSYSKWKWCAHSFIQFPICKMLTA